MESAFYDIYSLAEAYQKTYSFTGRTRSFPDIFQLVNKKSHAVTFHDVIFTFYTFQLTTELFATEEDAKQIEVSASFFFLFHLF